MLDALEQISDDLKQLETQKKEYENKIKALMEENEKAVVGDRLITWKSIISNRFDSKRFSEEYPDLHKKFTKQSSYRKFAVREVK